MSTLVCLLEERSAQEMLKSVLPKILPPQVDVRYISFSGKQDLEKQLERKIRLWQQPDSYFLVLRDQDSGDCHEIKARLGALVKSTGKLGQTLIRIACHELESFYLGDLAAVESGLGVSALSRQQRKAKFKNPDMLANASEELRKLTKKTYSKIDGSRAIAPHLALDGRNKSTSFNALIKGVGAMFREPNT